MQRELEVLSVHCQEVLLNNSITFDWKFDDDVCWMKKLSTFADNIQLPVSKIHSKNF